MKAKLNIIEKLAKYCTDDNLQNAYSKLIIAKNRDQGDDFADFHIDMRYDPDNDVDFTDVTVEQLLDIIEK